MQILNDNGRIVVFPNANEVFIGFLLVERRRPDSEILKDVFQ